MKRPKAWKRVVNPKKKTYDNLYIFTITTRMKKLPIKDHIKIMGLMHELGGKLPVVGGRSYNGKKADKYWKLVNGIE